METDSEPEMIPYDPESHTLDFNPFQYQDLLLTSTLSQAIATGNVDQIKALVKGGKNVNYPDNNGNIPLHLAVLADSLEMVQLLLTDSRVDHKNFNGFTPFLLGLLYKKSDDVLLALMKAGADIHATNTMKETALHLSVKLQGTTISEELIKSGANIDAQDDNYYTPLTQAVQCNNIDNVCLLLYYNADVNVQCLHNLTPFMYAVNNDEGYEIAKILFDYYDDFSSTTCDGYTPLLLAANSKNPLAIELVRAGADVNFFTSDGCTSLYLSLFFEDDELFKEIWCRIDYENILRYNSRFMNAFLNNNTFSTASWLQCFYLLLTSKWVEDIMGLSVTTLERQSKASVSLYTLFRAFHIKVVELNDRLNILCIFLSLGYTLSLSDVTLIYYLYGHNAELEVLIHHYDDVNKERNTLKCHPLPAFIFAMERNNYTVRYIAALIENQIKTMNLYTDRQVSELMILKSFRFFAIPYAIKRRLLYSTPFLSRETVEKITALPEVPSLVEICRNKFRCCLKNNCKIQKPYYFYNVVKNMHISQVIKDILIFKKALY